MKKSFLSITLLTALTSTSSFADITANVSASSNYYWRGVTQTNDAAAVSGGIDYSNKSGFYVGTWTSNIDFGSEASYELDFYAGFSKELESFSYDVGYIYYSYPDADGSTDFGELYGALSWQWLETKVSYLTHAQSDASSEEDMLYVELNASFTILTETELAFHLGRSSGDTVTEWYSEDDYLDYSVSLSKNGFTLGLTKTSLDDSDLKAFVSYSIDLTL